MHGNGRVDLNPNGANFLYLALFMYKMKALVMSGGAGLQFQLLKRLKQEYHRFKACLCYTVSSRLVLNCGFWEDCVDKKPEAIEETHRTMID